MYNLLNNIGINSGKIYSYIQHLENARVKDTDLYAFVYTIFGAYLVVEIVAVSVVC